MFNLQERTNKFLIDEVFPKMEINHLDENNIDDVYDFIVENYEVPLLNVVDEKSEKNITETKSRLDLVQQVLDDMSNFMDW